MALVEVDELLRELLLQDVRGEPGAIRGVIHPLHVEPDLGLFRWRCPDNLLDLTVLGHLLVEALDALRVLDLTLLDPHAGILLVLVLRLDQVFDLGRI